MRQTEVVVTSQIISAVKIHAKSGFCALFVLICALCQLQLYIYDATSLDNTVELGGTLIIKNGRWMGVQ
jgi:hypothetical protein